MPIINVKVSAIASAELTRAISEELLEHTVQILRKRRDLTAIAIDYVDPANWVVAGKTLVEHGKSSFYFDIKVVDETNTKDEKARYIQACFEGMQRVLGELHEESYIYIQDVRATAYGFGGKTQEFRYQHA